MLEEHKGGIAGMIIEPIMMNAGIIVPDAGYSRRPRRPAPRTIRHCSASTR